MFALNCVFDLTGYQFVRETGKKNPGKCRRGRSRPEQIVSKLWQIEVLMGQGNTVSQPKRSTRTRSSSKGTQHSKLPKDASPT